MKDFNRGKLLQHSLLKQQSSAVWTGGSFSINFNQGTKDVVMVSQRKFLKILQFQWLKYSKFYI